MMNLLKSSASVYIFYISFLSVLISDVSSQAVEGPDGQLLQFCTSTRNELIDNTRKRFESQDYSASGSGEVSFKKLSGSAKFDAQFKRQWDNFDHNVKQQYENRNCEEVMRQWGAVSIADIQANASIAVEKLELEGNKYSEDTKRIIGTAQEQTKREINSGDTTRTIITHGAGILSTIFSGGNEVEKERIRAATEKKRLEQELEIAKLRNETEKLRILGNAPGAAERRLIEQEPSLQARAPGVLGNDPGLALIQSWGLSSVSCSVSTASIDISGKQYCANATDKLVAGRYAYNPATRRLQRVDPLPAPAQPSDPNVTLLQSWGLAITSCNSSDTFIYMDNQRYCTIASGKFQKGQYVYDRAANRLRRAESSSPRSSSGFN
jgi:hypothetical protein